MALNMFILFVVVLSVINAECRKQAHYAESCYAECRYAERRCFNTISQTS